jgi:hypothetical protein
MPTKNETTEKDIAAPEKKTAKTYYITRAPGGSGERRQKLSDPIPDLRHIAEREQIIEVWHLAHDLKRELETAFNLIDALALSLRSTAADQRRHRGGEVCQRCGAIIPYR